MFVFFVVVVVCFSLSFFFFFFWSACVRAQLHRNSAYIYICIFFFVCVKNSIHQQKKKRNEKGSNPRTVNHCKGRDMSHAHIHMSCSLFSFPFFSLSPFYVYPLQRYAICSSTLDLSCASHDSFSSSSHESGSFLSVSLQAVRL